MKYIVNFNMDKLIEKHWETHVEKQKHIAIEEMAELTKEVIKDLRGKGDRSKIIEELADVLIGIESLQLIYDITDKEILLMKWDKELRTLSRIKSGYEK